MSRDEGQRTCQYPEFGSICGLLLPGDYVRWIERYPDLPLVPVCIRHYVLHEWLKQHDKMLRREHEGSGAERQTHMGDR